MLQNSKIYANITKTDQNLLRKSELIPIFVFSKCLTNKILSK